MLYRQNRKEGTTIDTRNENILVVKGLKKYFPIQKGFFRRMVNYTRAVDGVDFTIKKGETVGLVGESGSGKSTIGKAITRLAPVTEGEIHLAGERIDVLPESQFFPIRKKVQMIFQDPYNSLDPRMTVGKIVSEPLMIHFPRMTAKEREARVADLLEKVGLHASFANRYPHEFSGGQRQRISIARALSVEPELIICDESVSALDVSVQAQIVNLLQDLQRDLNLTYLFIAHDLAVIYHVSDYVLVMENGVLREQGDAETVYRNATDPYTVKLMEAVPKMPTIVAATQSR